MGKHTHPEPGLCREARVVHEWETRILPPITRVLRCVWGLLILSKPTMSLRLLFEPEHKATMRLLCDVLEVTGAGGKVPRWVIMGRELLGFQRDRFDDAYSFLTWARDGQKMTIAELIGAIENYAGGAILSKLRDMAAI